MLQAHSGLRSLKRLARAIPHLPLVAEAFHHRMKIRLLDPLDQSQSVIDHSHDSEEIRRIFVLQGSLRTVAQEHLPAQLQISDKRIRIAPAIENKLLEARAPRGGKKSLTRVDHLPLLDRTGRSPRIYVMGKSVFSITALKSSPAPLS